MALPTYRPGDLARPEQATSFSTPAFTQPDYALDANHQMAKQTFAHQQALNEARQPGLGDAHAAVLNQVPIVSDSGSLLDADLAAMPGAGDAHVQPISDLAWAHATAAAGVQAARGAYPFVTKVSDAGDAITGMGVRASRAALRGAAYGAAAGLGGRRHGTGIDWQHVPPPEATGRAARDALRPF